MQLCIGLELLSYNSKRQELRIEAKHGAGDKKPLTPTSCCS